MFSGIGHAEQKTWVSLIVTGAIYFYFTHRMTDHLDVVEQAPRGLITAYVAIVILFVVGEGLAVALFAAKARRAQTEADERDLDIRGKSDRNAYYFLITAINVLVFSLLMEAAFPGSYQTLFPMATLSELFYTLVSTLFIAIFVERISTLVYYNI